MNDKQKKAIEYVIYALIVFLIYTCLLWMGQFSAFQRFATNIENASFDLRQTIISQYKKPDKNLVILAVDDASYEYIMDKYGSWPISRGIWAEVINSIESVRPCYIIFDMLFLKPNLYDTASDEAFVETIKNNPNIYLSMNFDNYEDDVRKSPNLDNKFKLKVNGELQDNDYITFKNARTAMKAISDVTKNIGAINVTRDEDGIIRNITPIFKYKKDYYPNLSLLVGMDLYDVKSVTIQKNNVFISSRHKIPLDNTKRTILNWYGKSNTYTHIPLWKVIKAAKENDIAYLKKCFENKTIYVGTTATSLSDVKSTPVDMSMSGVEMHTTFLNNLEDNNFIKKTSAKADFIIAIILSLIVGYFTLKINSVMRSFIVLFAALFAYLFSITLGMLWFNVWVSVVIPVVSVILTFVLIYIEKYLLKSKDYEKTYKLAVTDGLTQLYNHRYFQEQMLVGYGNYKRYGNLFSLIMIDIDFFKKFNDTYGHQSGDAVLQQVAEILKKNLRTSDIACRYGGEELAVILTNTNNMDAILTANKICIAVRSHKFILVNGQKVNVTISLGVSTVTPDTKNPQEMIEFADKCLYSAKENGRNQVVSNPESSEA